MKRNRGNIRECWCQLFLLILAGWMILPGCASPHPIANAAPPSPVPEQPATTNATTTAGARPTIFIAGDSTAARGTGANQQGWAEPFAAYFDAEQVKIVNRARGGRSSRTFVSEGLWDQLLAEVKRGDIVLIQFGHNDGGALFTAPARGSLPGWGGETQTGPGRDGQPEVVHAYGWYLRRMIQETRAKGAQPIVLSLTVRAVWKNGRLERGAGHFDQWAAEVARAERVPFLDVSDLAADRLEPLGEAKVKEFYPRDHTHFNAAGADLHAAVVVAALQGLRPNPVRQWLSAKGHDVAADPIAWLYLPRAWDPALPSLFLIGDSTVRNGRGDGANGQWGWGDSLGGYFDQTKLNVVNRAVGGLSSRTFLTQGYWDRVRKQLKPGDFVVLQFGHNDNGAPTTPPPGRASLKGLGGETLALAPGTNWPGELVHTFGWYLRQYIADARANGATPIVCSLVPRKIWREGHIVRARESYAGWAEAVAREEKAPFLDLNEIIARHYDELGPDRVNPLFEDEHTHTSRAGAELNAASVVEALRELAANPLETFLKPDFTTNPGRQK